MSEAIRAFVAVRVSASPALERLLDELDSFGRSVKPVAAENLHLTVKFLGNTDSSWIGGIERVLRETAAQLPAFDVVLRGLGAFPSASRPSVIWTGMTPPEAVIQLAAAVEHALVGFGFAAETRAFHPHVTLARIKSRPPRELTALPERHAETELASFTVDELVLMRSELTPHGSRYTPLCTAGLR
ncbi:MAG: RNA 2',3'-cyclic phosphodiesterase [Planctomycetaceae bacterium]